MIGEDDYGEEEGEYGEEEEEYVSSKARKKVQEADYDFMWAVVEHYFIDY